MGKYSSVNRKASTPRVREVHPVMRGIGCIMMVIVPVISYGLSVMLVNIGIGRGWPIPPSWLGTPTFPPLLMRLSGPAYVISLLQTQTNLYANVIFAVAVAVVIGGVMSMIYGYIYTIFGPPQYGPLDEPPIRKRVKRYKR
jgi:hypothetical protein